MRAALIASITAIGTKPNHCNSWRVAIIKPLLQSIAILLASLPIAANADRPAPTSVPDASSLDTVVVTSSRIRDSQLGSSTVDSSSLTSQRAASSDSARLLENVPGVSLYSAGGISSLPVIRGLADDRLRTQVDGMDLMTACPNHMNSALSYIDPSKVGSITVFAGVTPVSVGGDSIGGTIQVKSADPEFTDSDEKTALTGKVGAFYRSNGSGRGYNVGATWFGNNFNIAYSESFSESNNYRAAKNFKPATPGSEGGAPIDGDIVGSSAYDDARNRDIDIALRYDIHLLQLGIGQQTVGFEGFPNQRMDMTDNDNTVLNILYRGNYRWGELEARVYRQKTKHKMDMGTDRYSYGTGMPMDTEGTTEGAALQANWVYAKTHIFRLGAEYQNYTLYDWWPAVGGTMGPNAFWNIDYGQRDKYDAFVEWENTWKSDWLSLIGVRSNNVITDAAAVQGYDNSLSALWGNDAAAFNALDHQRIDHNWDATGLLRYTASAMQTYEVGFARKAHSPNLYQRYPWSTQPMAALMNNFVGDGNGYIGNGDLKPEIAKTLSLTADWHDAAQKNWNVKTTGYYTHIDDYIDAKRCDFGQCSAENVTTTDSFVLLQYVNQSARLYGADIAADKLLGESRDYGRFTGTAIVNYVRGKNRTTGDNLYNIMPLNMKLSLAQRLRAWTTTAEVQLVDAKTNISQVRNEIQTGGYSIFNLRGSYEWKQARLDVGIENVFNRFYADPLGGAYVGQGPSMTTNGIAWGVAVPGKGRSINTAINVNF